MTPVLTVVVSQALASYASYGWNRHDDKWLSRYLGQGNICVNNTAHMFGYIFSKISICEVQEGSKWPQNAINVLIWPKAILDSGGPFMPPIPPGTFSWLTSPNMKYNVQPSFTNVEPIWGGFNHLWPIWQFWAKICHFWGLLAIKWPWNMENGPQGLTYHNSTQWTRCMNRFLQIVTFSEHHSLNT